MSKSSIAVKKWRMRTKERMILAMGGSCKICEYSKCNDALEFHHLDPNEKEFAMGRHTANPASWPRIVEELRKCILLCCLCHREVHAGMIEVPEVPSSGSWFNEEYTEYESLRRQMTYDQCPVCGKQKPEINVTCSLSCAAKHRGKVDWTKYDIVALCSNASYESVGRLVGCTGAAVKKRFLKITR